MKARSSEDSRPKYNCKSRFRLHPFSWTSQLTTYRSRKENSVGHNYNYNKTKADVNLKPK